MAKLILTSNTSFGAGADHKIYRSVDGVSVSSIDVDFRVLNVQALSLSNAVAIGTDEDESSSSTNEVFGKYSTDGGLTWIDSVGIPSGVFRVIDVSRLGSSVAVVSLMDSYGINLYKTIDGGANYELISEDNIPYVRFISWINESTAFSVEVDKGNKETRVNKTTNGGLTWDLVNNVDIPYFNNSFDETKIAAFDSGVVYVYGKLSSDSTKKIYKSTDSGVTFSLQSTVGNNFRQVGFADETTVYSTYVSGNLRVSTDSGLSFTATTMPASNGASINSSGETYTTENGKFYTSTDFGTTWNQALIDGALTLPTTTPNTYFAYGYNTNGFTFSEVEELTGCTSLNALNYDPSATIDDASCTFAFKLVDLVTSTEIIVDNNLIGLVDRFVKIDGDDLTCYQVQYSNTLIGAVTVTLQPTDYPDQNTCELSIPTVGPSDPNAYNDVGADVSDGSEKYAFRLTDVRGIENDIITWDDFVDLTSFVGGAAIKIDDYPSVCWTVEYQTDMTGYTAIDVTVTDDYVDGATCELTLPQGYKLTDVAGNAPTLITDSDLSSYVGQVVKVDGARVCFLVENNPNIIGAVPVNVYTSYVDGDACLLSFESTNDFECADEVEVEVVEPAFKPKPARLNSYYQSKYKLDQVVREFLIERGEDTEHNYPRFLQLAVNGLRELNMDISGSSKMVVLEVKDDMTVDLPEDFINYTKIAICNQDGELMSLGHNPKLCKPRHADECGNLVHGGGVDRSASALPINIDNISSHFRNGEVVGRFFGEGGGFNANGQYVLDKERGVIQLSSVVGEEIVLEYLADITKIDGNFTIHPYAIEALKRYIHWASLRLKTSIPAHEKELARRDYYNERRIAGVRFNSFTMEEAMATIRKSFKLSPKL
jgi:hypothetical protein